MCLGIELGKIEHCGIVWKKKKMPCSLVGSEQESITKGMDQLWEGWLEIDNSWKERKREMEQQKSHEELDTDAFSESISITQTDSDSNTESLSLSISDYIHIPTLRLLLTFILSHHNMPSQSVFASPSRPSTSSGSQSTREQEDIIPSLLPRFSPSSLHKIESKQQGGGGIKHGKRKKKSDTKENFKVNPEMWNCLKTIDVATLFGQHFPSFPSTFPFSLFPLPLFVTPFPLPPLMMKISTAFSTPSSLPPPSSIPSPSYLFFSSLSLACVKSPCSASIFQVSSAAYPSSSAIPSSSYASSILSHTLSLTLCFIGLMCRDPEFVIEMRRGRTPTPAHMLCRFPLSYFTPSDVGGKFSLMSSTLIYLCLLDPVCASVIREEVNLENIIKWLESTDEFCGIEQERKMIIRKKLIGS
eukprot:gnl/Carplike_NY0171/2659_a3573_398.p1 GENE.gnl/Carplike_NY0171/2659_a3573_398~~gnl/Carplike_NY0171/2659_a3573_398.p1  ORF type:complete len:414 (-),score=93.03 gnl/Carplike_NY0171/2659_a3573_398:1097-2338(-)